VKQVPQYTIRNIPDSLDRELRDRAGRNKTSLNDAVIDVIKRGLGVTETVHVYNDLDDLAGSWQDDEAFDRAIADQDSVDVDAWR
jgi:plasmid stability protein